MDNFFDTKNTHSNETEVVQDLRIRLAQVEAAFEAVLSHEVDAVLDSESMTPIMLKKTHDTLWKREKQLSQAEQLAHLGSWTWDIPENRITWSAGLFQIFGIPARDLEFTLESSLQWIHPEDREIVRNHIMNALQDQDPQSLRYRVIRPDGYVRTLLSRVEVFYDPKGHPVQMIGIGLDISERVASEKEMDFLLDELRLTEQKLRIQNEVLKIAQDQLLQERQRYHDLFEFAPDGYLVTDTNGTILEANQAAIGLLAEGKDLLPGDSLIHYIPSEERTTFQTMLSQVVKSEEVRGWESVIQTEEGATIPIVMIVASKRDLWGKPLALRWQLHDISERKRAAEILIASQQRLHTIITGAPLLLWAVNLDKKITYLEGKVLNSLGLNHRDFIDMPISDFLLQSPQVLDHIESTLSGEEVVGTLTVGELILETRYSLLRDLKGEISGVIGVAFDITAQKQLESELVEMNGRLIQSREKDRSELSREIHDGPVQDMYGILFHLKAFTDALPLGVNRAPVQTLHTSLQQVIDTLRTICGELRPPTLSPFGLEKAIRSHASSFKEANPEIDLELDLMSDGHELPEFDRLALFRNYQQAINNVVRHANARKVSVRLELSDENVTLTVQDDGDGFLLPKKWIEFARSGRLGLIDAIERAEALGGNLAIESEIGKGTKIKTTIPRQGSSFNQVMNSFRYLNYQSPQGGKSDAHKGSPRR